MDARERTVSRRSAVSMLGIGMAAASTSVSAQDGNSTQARNEATMQDPRSKYPKPPFREQTQPWPGLAQNMDPRSRIMARPVTADQAG